MDGTTIKHGVPIATPFFFKKKIVIYISSLMTKFSIESMKIGR